MKLNFSITTKLSALLLLIVFSFPPSSYSQASNIDPKLIINKCLLYYNALNSYSLDFVVTAEKNKTATNQFNGKIWIKKEKYFVKFEDQVVVSDGKTVWNYQKNSNEVTLFSAEEDDVSYLHPINMMKNWENDYSAKFIKEEVVKKKNALLIDLTPKKRESYQKVRLFINKETNAVIQLILFETETSTIKYEIIKFVSNVNIIDSKFIFTKTDYPNVEIIDLR